MAAPAGVNLRLEASDGGLRELVMWWFTETQAPLVLQERSFPDWFHGFVQRKDAEDLLRDKTRGCFLVRLTDKAIGFILSYRGLDRCHHFVITQNSEGRLVISGDWRTHENLKELIEHHKGNPIQPFGEYLTCSCRQVNMGELYDVVNYKVKREPGVSVQALRSIWDQKTHRHIQQHSDPPAVQPPALPPKSKTRKLKGTVSVNATTLSQNAPPIPNRGIPLGFTLSGSLPDTTSDPGQSQDANRAEGHQGRSPGYPSPRAPAGVIVAPEGVTGVPAGVTMASTGVTGATGPQAGVTGFPAGAPDAPGASHAPLTLLESRSRSLPKLDTTSQREDKVEYSDQLTSCSGTSGKKVTCHTYSLHDHRGASWLNSSGPDDLEILRSNPLYQTSEWPEGSLAPQGDAIPMGSSAAGLPDDTYEQVPGQAAAGNMYETLDDMREKKAKSTWSKNNQTWKTALPDFKKK